MVHLFSVTTVENCTWFHLQCNQLIIIILSAYLTGVFSFECEYSTENKYSLIQCRLHDSVQLGLCYTNPNSIFSVHNNNDDDKHSALWSVFLLT